MINIKQTVDNLDIKTEFTDLLYSTINAELFDICRLYSPVIDISKFQNENDRRVFCEVKVYFTNTENISLFQCRPFIDKGVTMTTKDNSIIMRKTYYIHED